MSSTNNEQFLANLKRNLQEHRPMLSDGIRNKLIYKALEKNITNKTRFLDIGSGTGVWAILAAKLGAKRVVAVELEESLIPIIYQHAKENGVVDKIEIIHDNIDNVSFDDRFDLIISELFGHDPFGSRTINSFINVRENLLAKKGVLIPLKMIQLAVPVHIEASIDKIGENLPFESSFFKAIDLNFIKNYSIENRNNIKILAEPKELLRVDFRNINEAPNLQNLSQIWEFDEINKINAFAVYNHSFYTDKLHLDLFDSSSWVVGIYEFNSIIEDAKDIKFEITFKNKQLNWKVSSPSSLSVKPQIFSPGFAVARTKMALANTKFKSSKFDNK